MNLKKTVSWMLCVCVLAMCAGVIGYEFVRIRMAPQPAPAPEGHADVSVSAAEAPANGVGDVRETEPGEYYIVRMNGDKLGVFIRRNDAEEFFYNAEVDLSSLSEQDQALLVQGTVLYTKEELAKFMEDFTS